MWVSQVSSLCCLAVMADAYLPDGTCSFAHRMQNAGDHTEIEELAKAIGAKVTPTDQWKRITDIMS